MVPQIEIKEPHLLVVEGKDEEKFIGALIKRLTLPAPLQIFGIGGKTQLRGNLKALTLSPNFSTVDSLGIMRDADEDPAAAFQSVCSDLKNAGLPVPAKPLESASGRPRVTVMILPAENEKGMLEDVCLKAVAQDLTKACIDQYFQCVKEQDGIHPRNIAKARVQIFLASQLEPGKRLGESAETGYWPLEHEAFEPINKFLQSIVASER